MKKKTADYAFPVYLLCITILCLFKVYFAYIVCNGYAFADWLINYQEVGFSRRGLLGTVFVFLYEAFSIKLQYSVFFVQAAVHIAFFCFLFRLFRYRKANIIDALFFLTPFCLWGFFSDPAIGARKDGILWLLFTAFAYCLTTNRLTRTKEYVFLALFALSVFIHESFIFYAQYFILALYLHNGQADFKRYALILLSFYLPAGIVLLTGVNTDYHKTLQLIRECGIDLQKENIFQWQETQLIKIDYYTKEFRKLSWYAVSAALQMGFIVFYMQVKKLAAGRKKQLFRAFAFAFCISLPLFLIAIDTGRWFYNNFILFAVLLLTMIPVSETKFLDSRILESRKAVVFIILVVLADFVYRVPSALIGIQMGLPLRAFLHFF